VAWCPKRLQVEDHTYISGSMDERITMSSWCFHEPQQKIIRYIWIFRSSMKSTFQRIKHQGNWRFLQADMAESPKVARAKILDNKAVLKWNSHSSLNRTPIKTNEYPLER
jgi:hypothetical protein